MATSLFYVGLDVGGTSMKAGVVDDCGTPASAISLPTEVHRGQNRGLQRMCETIRTAVSAAHLEMNQIAAIGVAAPGTADLPAGVILDPVNLRPWVNVPVRRYIHDAFNVPTAFQNDANAAAFGEFWAGAGRNTRSMVLFTLGTGIGGGIILAGPGGEACILEGQHSHAAELGHVKIDLTNTRSCGCGRFGCLEAYASATAIVKRTIEALSKDPGKSCLHCFDARPAELTAHDVFDAAKKSDELAARIVEDTAFYLAVGAVNLMHTIDPDMVVFGGGMIAAGPAFLERIRHHVRSLAFPVLAERTQVCYAELGNDAGFIGAAGCGRLLVRARAQ